MFEEIASKYNYWIYILLMMIGFYAMIAKRNLVKKIIGMNIFQTAIILFFISNRIPLLLISFIRPHHLTFFVVFPGRYMHSISVSLR